MKDAVKAGILDLYLVNHWAINFATDAAVTVLRVDQVTRHVQFVVQQNFRFKMTVYAIIFLLF